MSLTKDTPFPTDPNDPKPLIGLFVINSANLYSSVCDAEHVSDLLFSRLHAIKVVILFDAMSALNKVSEYMCKHASMSVLLQQGKIVMQHVATKNALMSTISSTCKDTASLGPCNMMMLLSSHGYSCGHENFIHFNGARIIDAEFRVCMMSSLPESTNCLALIDACSSGSFMNLRYQCHDPKQWIKEVENPVLDQYSSKRNLVCIGAVSDNQYDQDDISDLGYDGGLSSSLIDYYMSFIDHDNDGTLAGGDKLKSIGGFFKYFHARIAAVHNIPQLSFNCEQFVSSS